MYIYKTRRNQLKRNYIYIKKKTNIIYIIIIIIIPFFLTNQFSNKLKIASNFSSLIISSLFKYLNKLLDNCNN